MRRELLALAAILLLTGCAVVEPGARGIKKSLGRMDAHLYQPGMVAYNPLTDAVTHMNIQQQTVERQSTGL